MASTYTDAQIDMIAKWLRDGLSGGAIADKLSAHCGRVISRSAVVGLVHRDKRLAAHGFARAPKSIGRQRGWTDDEVRQACELWAQGCDARAIGVRLDRTAKSVANYIAANREHFPMRADAHRSSGAVGGMMSRVRHGVVADRMASDLLPQQSVDSFRYDDATRRLPLAELGWQDCRFAVNDAAPGEMHLFCGLAVVPGRSWCRHHLHRCLGTGSEAERNADRMTMRARAA